MNGKPATKERVSSSIPRALNQELEAKAQELGISKSALIQECLEHNLGKVSAVMKQASETQRVQRQEIDRLKSVNDGFKSVNNALEESLERFKLDCEYAKTVNAALMKRNWFQRLLNKPVVIERQTEDTTDA